MLDLSKIIMPQGHYRVFLSRKETLNADQNARKRIEYVIATSKDEAKTIALSMPQNRAFRVSSIEEMK